MRAMGLGIGLGREACGLLEQSVQLPGAQARAFGKLAQGRRGLLGLQPAAASGHQGRGVGSGIAGLIHGLVGHGMSFWVIGCPTLRSPEHPRIPPLADPKSTRLNSSHPVISYAVLCLYK